jgi:hypothetical protein
MQITVASSFYCRSADLIRINKQAAPPEASGGARNLCVVG